MTRVLAQGTFDVLHPGHVHYLTASAGLGDELVAAVAADDLVPGRDPFVGAESRRAVAADLAVVDEALVGEDLWSVLDAVEPAVLTLGPDQEVDRDRLRVALSSRGVDDVDLVRIEARGGRAAVERDVTLTGLERVQEVGRDAALLSPAATDLDG